MPKAKLCVALVCWYLFWEGCHSPAAMHAVLRAPTAYKLTISSCLPVSPVSHTQFEVLDRLSNVLQGQQMLPAALGSAIAKAASKALTGRH